MLHLEIALSPQRRAALHLPERMTEAELARLEALIDLVRAVVLIEEPDAPSPDQD